MPCYRCGVRQTDPIRGPSPWKRAVRAGTQVLVCPDCQRIHDWAGDVDHCATCGSVLLVRILGETQCRACGATGERAAPGDASHAPGTGAVATDGTAPAGTGPTVIPENVPTDTADATPAGTREAATTASRTRAAVTGTTATHRVAGGATITGSSTSDLADDVEAALDRLFGRA